MKAQLFNQRLRVFSSRTWNQRALYLHIHSQAKRLSKGWDICNAGQAYRNGRDILILPMPSHRDLMNKLMEHKHEIKQVITD